MRDPVSKNEVENKRGRSPGVAVWVSEERHSPSNGVGLMAWVQSPYTNKNSRAGERAHMPTIRENPSLVPSTNLGCLKTASKSNQGI